MKPCPTRGHLLGACVMAGRPMSGSGIKCSTIKKCKVTGDLVTQATLAVVCCQWNPEMHMRHQGTNVKGC
jgi:hypothetical protein